MTTQSSIKNRGLLGFAVFSPSFNLLSSLLRRILLSSLLIGLIWLPGLSNSALAESISTSAMSEGSVAQTADSIAKDDRIIALIVCLPQQLSQPSLKRALNEMGNDQLQRVFHLKTNPKLSQAEIELASCLNGKGFTS